MGKSSRDKGLRRERAIVDIHTKCGLRGAQQPGREVGVTDQARGARHGADHDRISRRAVSGWCVVLRSKASTSSSW